MTVFLTDINDNGSTRKQVFGVQKGRAYGLGQITLYPRHHRLQLRNGGSSQARTRESQAAIVRDLRQITIYVIRRGGEQQSLQFTIRP
ncbi:MAG: hypothetical protein GEU75_01740 [Dehalococcoidia bacterium]|nr:hypothetical protein [Dehalococcoidia bacterium]